MTQETLNMANEIANKIEELEQSLIYLQNRISERETEIKSFEKGEKKKISLPKWFCKGIIKKDGKVALNVSAEYNSIDFELDKECVDFIIQHKKEKIDKLKKEFAEL